MLFHRTEVREKPIGYGRSLITRLIIATLLLGSGGAVYWLNGADERVHNIAVILGVFYAVTFFFFILSPAVRRFPSFFGAIQIIFDIGLASAVVFVTGGRGSPFIFLYALIIVFASITSTKTASYTAAAVCGITYFFIVVHQLLSGIDLATTSLSTFLREQKGIEYTYFNLAGFILIAMLSSYFAEKINVTRRELQESTESLNTLKNIHENILDSLTSGVITLDTEGRIIEVNKTGLQILGLDSEINILGTEIKSLMPGIKLTELVSKKREEMKYSQPAGKPLTLGFSSSVLTDKTDEMQGYIMIFQDLTKVKELEERLRASEKMALLGQLSAALAHEVRNPLSAISGSVEMLRDEVKHSDENLKLLRITTQEVEKLNLIVEDFLLFAKPESKSATPIDIGATISETVEAFSMSSRRTNLEISSDIEKDVYVVADAYRLKQVVWNLMLNSMQAMPEGGKIRVESHAKNGIVEISVIDNGNGIPEEIMSKIFEPFFSTKEIGTGLGLAIVQKVVKGYNGDIKVTSAKNKGTIFVMTLPRTNADMNEAEQAEG